MLMDGGTGSIINDKQGGVESAHISQNSSPANNMIIDNFQASAPGYHSVK